jgi:hypothetical protein
MAAVSSPHQQITLVFSNAPCTETTKLPNTGRFSQKVKRPAFKKVTLQHFEVKIGPLHSNPS